MSKLEWGGNICIVAALLAWAAIVLISIAFPGGHPPLSAYITGPIILALLPTNLAGLLMGLIGVKRGRGVVATWRNVSVVAGNMMFLTIGIILMYKTFL